MTFSPLPLDEIAPDLAASFAALRSEVSRWEPSPCPRREMTAQQEAWFAAYGETGPERVPFLDEIERPKWWLR